MKVLGLLLIYVSYAGITDRIYWRDWCKVFKTNDWKEALVCMDPKLMRELKQKCWSDWQKDNPDDPEGFNVLYSFTINCIRVVTALVWPWTWFYAFVDFLKSV